jgi:hypothetical protein
MLLKKMEVVSLHVVFGTLIIQILNFLIEVTYLRIMGVILKEVNDWLVREGDGCSGGKTAST